MKIWLFHTILFLLWVCCTFRNAPCHIRKQVLDAQNLLLPGVQRYVHEILNNRTLEFTCREGYVITPPSVRNCVDGRIDLPSCLPERGRNCSRPPTIENGDIITLSQKHYTSGSSVEFKCQRYYAMEGYHRSFCNNGNWTKVPSCLEPCAISLTESQKIDVKGRSHENPAEYLQRGDSLELNCKPGYVLATNSSQTSFTIQCNEKPIVYPECKEITCKPPRVANGTFKPQRKIYQDGDLLRVECGSGVQHHIVECTKNGWSPPPSCVTKSCDYPFIENQEIVFSWLYFRRRLPKRLGETIYFSCDEGYLPANKQIRHHSTCTTSGWDPEPKCFKKCDPSINFMPHGFPYNDPNAIIIEGEELSFSCDKNYDVQPQRAKALCTKNGWVFTQTCAARSNVRCSLPPRRNAEEPAYPLNEKTFAHGYTVRYRCRPGYIALGHIRLRCSNGIWEPVRPYVQCRKKPCGQPEDIQHGSFELVNGDGFVFGARIVYRCDDGYQMRDQTNYRECRVDGWSNDVPQCEAARERCETPPPIENGDILETIRREYALGSTVTYRCQNLYIMKGQPQVQCRLGRWTEAPRCIAPCTVIEEDTQSRNIQLKWKAEQKLYSRSGDEVEFICRRGYRPDPTSPPFRVRCTEGSLEYPRCIPMGN